MIAGLLAGCQSTPRVAGPLVPTPESGRSTNTLARIRSLDSSVGRVESVRRELSLVVLDYSLSTLPPIGVTLTVNRAGTAVGRVRVTGPTRAGTGKIAGEILSGEAQSGDTVRGE